MAKYFLKLGGHETEAEVDDSAGELRVRLGGEWRRLSLRRLGSSPHFALGLEGRAVDVFAVETAQGFSVHIDGLTFNVETQRPAPFRRGGGGRGADDTSGFQNGRWTLRSPMTGAVIDVRVAVGDTVAEGTVLMVIEAMKMQNDLRSRVAGHVSAVNVEKGQRVETGAVLMVISAAPAGNDPA